MPKTSESFRVTLAVVVGLCFSWFIFHMTYFVDGRSFDSAMYAVVAMGAFIWMPLLMLAMDEPKRMERR